ncbi:MAG: ATP-binding cassette domain-containing protein, partial [Dorea sp.]|nr:ATP-binding cassette domain-containing protein [Dorea sp.]
MAVITIENLKYKYPNTDRLALDGISLTIEKGEFIGIVGKNGAGKSTLSQAIIGLVPQFYKGAYGGKVLVHDKQADTYPVCEMCEHVGLIFQNPFNQLSGAKDTVFGEVAYGLQNLGIERNEMKRRVEMVMKQLDIWQYRDRNPFDLSGGQMQRVAIASILVMQPDVIILDEPTSQLDPQGTEEVFRVVDQLRTMGITIIMIEQKLEKIAAYCDRIILMSEGKVLAFDTPEKIFSRNDLAELGVQAPAFTRIAKEFGLKNADGTYPATLEATEKLFKGKAAASELARMRQIKKSTGETKNKGENIFTTKDLDFSYIKNVTIFDHLNLTLDRRPTAIIGQNGAGKTTLVRLLKGLLKPTGGKIYFGQDDIS